MKTQLITALVVAALTAVGVPSGWAQGDAGTPAQVSTASSPVNHGSNTPDAGEVAADALLVRPVSFAATAVGAAIFVVALPFAALSKDVKGTGRALVGAPAAFTFKRKLGDFSGSRQW